MPNQVLAIYVTERILSSRVERGLGWALLAGDIKGKSHRVYDSVAFYVTPTGFKPVTF